MVQKDDELIRKLFYGKLQPEEAKLIAEELLKKELKNGDLIMLIEILFDYELEGQEWAKQLKKKAIKKLKKIEPKTEGERKYIQKIIEEYSR
jgi:hypothetical protein